MTSLLPLKPSVEGPAEADLEPKLVGLEDADSDRILSAISSTTARRILGILYDEPQTASDIAAELDSSVQNVSYHLDRLVDVELVEVVETWYSKQGREMDVYAPTNSTLVLYAGAERATPSLTTALRRVFGAVGVIGLMSVLVHSRWTATQPPARAARTPMNQPEPTLWESLVSFGTGPGGLILGLGLLSVLCLFVAWYWRAYRPTREFQRTV
ncbi:ArsR/SmtB family transcription factor [Halovenus rubra]|uniref:ArsR/SmtB family transcription factor n=2 Tax=Halovenus rubra TaxID=869890 RepID=A0ABD5XBA3_9EURY|nr:helix-turn-helix domain-containing protein [Halovenus rubra]